MFGIRRVAGTFDDLAGFHDLDRGTFARQDRFAHMGPCKPCPRTVKGIRRTPRDRAAPRHRLAHILFKERREQVRVILEHLPQHGQQALVGQQRFPCGFKKQTARAFDVVRVIVAQQVFPRVEFEQDGDAPVLIIQKQLLTSIV